jgi:hypothetical protein
MAVGKNGDQGGLGPYREGALVGLEEGPALARVALSGCGRGQDAAEKKGG